MNCIDVAAVIIEKNNEQNKENESFSVTTLSLFPHSPKTQLNDQSKKLHMLKLYKFLIGELNESLFLFTSKKLNKFDPHVGDTLCQIRAYKILMLTACKGFQLNFNLDYFSRLIQQTIEDFEILIKQKNGKYSKELDKAEEIYSFLQRKNLIFELPEDLVFLVQAKMLSDYSKVDTEGISRGIDYNKFSQKAYISKSLAKRIMHYYQQNLAKMSCFFLMSLLNDLPELSELKSSLYLLLQKDKDGRWVLPCYEVTKILVKHIVKTRTPIVLIIERKGKKKIDTLTLLLMPEETSHKLKIITDPMGVDLAASMIIKGVTKYFYPEQIETKNHFIERLSKLGLENVIMANMACHPQYSAPELEYLNDDPYLKSLKKEAQVSEKNNMQMLKDEFLKMKEIGGYIGCSISNPILFLIKHIFCDFYV